METTLNAETFLTQQETALRAAVQEAIEAEKLAQEDYLAGLADIVTVLESQRRVFDAKRSLLQLQNQRHKTASTCTSHSGEFAAPNPQ